MRPSLHDNQWGSTDESQVYNRLHALYSGDNGSSVFQKSICS